MSAQAFTFPEIDPYRPENAAVLTQLDFKAADIEPQWLVDMRQTGLASVQKHGLPTPLLERWKYTNLAMELQDMQLTWADSGFMDGVGPVENDTASPRLGVGDTLGGTISGGDAQATKNWVQEMLTRNPPPQGRFDAPILWDVGRAYLRNTVVIDVAQGQELEPITLDFSNLDGQFTQTHLIIRLAAGTRLRVEENHSGWGAYWRNTNTVIELGAGARLDHIRHINDSDQAISTHSSQIAVGQGANYQQQVLLGNARMLRNDLYAALKGPQANATINGAILPCGEALLDQTILIDHLAPDCTSNQMFRNVLKDRAQAVFQGKVFVDQVAQRTDGYQLCNTVSLSDHATMSAKPELEIYADDVKCSHGATMGALEDEALFYCRARGIPEAAARRLLLEAFIAEAITDEALFAHTNEFLSNV